MQVSRYQSFLRVSVLVALVALVFDSGLLTPVTKHLSENTFLYLADVGVGMFASVPQNEINSLSAQIAERQRILDAREAELREREIQAREYESGTLLDYSTFVMSVVLFILTVLLVLNYVMDWIRAHPQRTTYGT